MLSHISAALLASAFGDIYIPHCWDACFFKYSCKFVLQYVLNQFIQTHFKRMSSADKVQGAQQCSYEWINPVQLHFNEVSLFSQTQERLQTWYILRNAVRFTPSFHRTSTSSFSCFNVDSKSISFPSYLHDETSPF